MPNGDERGFTELDWAQWRGRVAEQLDNIEGRLKGIEKSVRCGNQSFFQRPGTIGAGSGGLVVAITKLIEVLLQ